ncbi:protein-methionine-sulfoxide reductase heme-binding subunit MsrQ [soil metagenome]
MPPAPSISARLQRIPLWLVYLVGFVPGASTFYLALSDQLGADPVKALEHTLGLWALRLLIVTLLVTPLRQSFGINLIRYRRAFGLLAFYYVCFHLATYLLLDQGVDLGAIIKDIVKRPYITIGMAAFVLLIPLAVTSNRFSIRRLGGWWMKVHKLVYGAIALGAIHFIMVVKSWPPEPLIYAAIVASLLLYRVWKSAHKPGQRHLHGFVP